MRKFSTNCEKWDLLNSRAACLTEIQLQVQNTSYPFESMYS